MCVSVLGWVSGVYLGLKLLIQNKKAKINVTLRINDQPSMSGEKEGHLGDVSPACTCACTGQTIISFTACSAHINPKHAGY